MDPDEALSTLRRSRAEWFAIYQADKTANELHVLDEEFMETFHDLDEWLTRGGFLPSEWVHFSHKPVAAMDLDVASDTLSEATSTFTRATATQPLNRAQLRGLLHRVSTLASHIADAIALGEFPELNK